LGNQGKYILTNYDSDKLDTADISSLSLFLYSRAISVLAKNSSQEIIGVHVYSFEDQQQLFEIIDTDSLIQSANTYGKLFVHNRDFCLIPSQLFDPSHKEKYLYFTAEVDTDSSELFYEPVPSSEIQVIGSLSVDIVTKLEEHLPDLEIIPGALFPLSFLFRPGNVLDDQEIFLFPIPDHYYLAAFSLGTLIFFNIFQADGDEDVLKYTLAVVQQLGFDQETVKLTITGDLSYVQAAPQVLSPYFSNISKEIPQPTAAYVTEQGPADFKSTGLLEAFWTL